MIRAAAGFTCYFCVFGYYDIIYDDLSGHGPDWIDDGKKFVIGLDYDTRMNYLRQAQTSFLVSIVIAQWADVMICKTRSLSIFQQGMWNTVLNIGLLEETLLALALVYLPPLHAAFKTAEIKFIMWTYALPFSFLIFAYDEARKFFLRRSRDQIRHVDLRPALLLPHLRLR